MKGIISTLAAILFTVMGITSLSAQVTDAEKDIKKRTADTLDGWKYGGNISTSLSQVALVNWAAGGQSSVSVNGITSLFATYKSGSMLWESYLDIAYGTMKQGEDGWRKTDDRFDFTSKYGQKASSNLYYAGLINFRTQMTEGYNYPNYTDAISRFLAPAYLLGAIGIDYNPGDNFTLFLAPLTGKMTIVNDETLSAQGAFGVDPGKKFRGEFGGYLRLFMKHEIMENITLQTKFDLFSNYLDKPQNIDVSLEALLSMKVNQYISATIMTQLIYDDDVAIVVERDESGNPLRSVNSKVQFKEVLGIGFSYRF